MASMQDVVDSATHAAEGLKLYFYPNRKHAVWPISSHESLSSARSSKPNIIRYKESLKIMMVRADTPIQEAVLK
jgi:hypothetical protein